VVVEQAGAVTFRNDKQIEFLIIRSKKNPALWVFPKGHLEPGECFEEAATRELFEEAGISGQLIDYLGTLEFTRDETIFRVRYFLHKSISESGVAEAGRNPKWGSYDEIASLLSFQEMKELLNTANQYCLKIN
jgi:8-oxo-dGTP pyrophosphatase MutT (NUDIX family)